MQSITKITLPQPCHEPWANMNTIENGRYCSSCNKAVVDFTTMTNQQIIDHLSASTGNICGRITAPQFNQVNKQLSKPVQPNAGVWKRIMLTITMLASLSYVKGQTSISKAKTEQTQETLVVGEAVAVAAPLKYMTLTGVVKDNKGEPLQQVIVTAGNQSTLTNATGAFRLKVTEGTKEFQVKYIGFETTTIKINKKQGQPYQIKIQPATAYLGGLGVIKQPGVIKAFYQTYLANLVKAFIG